MSYSARYPSHIDSEFSEGAYQVSKVDSDLDIVWCYYDHLDAQDLVVIKKLSIKAKVAMLKSLVAVATQVQDMCY